MTVVYRPLLKTKAGEVKALKELSPAARRKVQPIFHVTSAVASSFNARLGVAWSGLPMALDGLFNFSETGSANATENLFRSLSASGVDIIPCVDFAAPVGYVKSIQGLLSKSGPRVLVKATLKQLPDIEKWVATQGWKSADIDLLVIAGSLAEFGVDMLEPLVIKSLTDNISEPTDWNSISLAASAAPRDMGTVNRGRNLIPRLDWELWKRVSSQFQHQLDYGDYATGHPDLTEPPAYMLGSATVSVKYTVEKNWIIIKGHQVKGLKGIPMSTQYRDHASSLIKESEFNKVLDCWADDKIRDIAAGKSKAGNRETWVQIAVNRHLSLTAHLLT